MPSRSKSDEELRDALWGTVPIECELDRSSMKDPPERPPVCHFMIPRQGYLFLALDHIRSEFGELISNDGALWLSHEGEPVPWQHPVAAWVDALAAKRKFDRVDQIMPLRLTAHLAKPPDTVQPFTDSRMARLLVFERLKAALTVRFGSTNAMRELRERRRADYDALYASVKNNEPVAFTNARRRLEIIALSLVEHDEAAKEANAAAASKPGTPPPEDGAAVASSRPGAGAGAGAGGPGGGANAATTSSAPDAQIPLILHRPGTGKLALRGITASKRSFGAVLKDLLPVELEDLTPEQCYSDERLPEMQGFALVQSVAPLLSTPIDALYEAFACVDGFLHVSVAFYD